jgi:MTH538 TIR-like domain (DUF1863)
MAYRNKVYVCFDADEDMRYYNLLKAWKNNDKFELHFHNAHEINRIMPNSSEDTIKRNLRERMKNTKLLIVLVGQHTRNLHKYVRWEMDLALQMDIPIIAVNLNGKNGIDLDFCPAIIRDKTVVHIPFKEKAVRHAMTNWLEYYPEAKRKNEINLSYKSFD